MTFQDVDMLWLIWALPVLGFVGYWGIRKRARILARFSTARGLSNIAPDTAHLRQWLKAGMLLGVLLLLVVCLAGPQYGYRWQEIERKGVDLIVAIDCSRSMLATDIQPTRLDRAKREIVDLLNLLQGDRVGLVAFSGTAFLQCPLTLDYEAFHLFLGALTPGFLPVGGTDLATAVTTALDGFNKEDVSEKAIILITDGESTGDDPLAAARAAADAKVRLFCIGVGALDGVPIPGEDGQLVKDAAGNIVLTRLDEATLKKMAVLTGGSYVRSVAGDMDLEAIYIRHIRKEMSASTLSQQKKKILEDRYQWFLALALLALVFELLIPTGRTPGKIGVAVILGAFLWLGGGIVGVPAAGASDTDHTIRSSKKPSLGQSIEQGETAYAAGDYEQALTHFIDAQLDAPDRPEIYYNMGNAQYKAGDFESAINHYKQALTADAPALRQQAHYNIGNCLFRLGKYEEALASYGSALEIDAGDAQAKENMAFVKHVMAQPKPPPQQGGDSREDPKDPDPNKDPNQDQNQAGHSPEGSQGDSDEKQSAGRDDTDSRENPDPGQATSPPPKPAESESPEKQAESGAQASDGSAQQAMDAQARQQAEKMLNRLEDQPGRALMPAYRERTIEKDW